MATWNSLAVAGVEGDWVTPNLILAGLGTIRTTKVSWTYGAPSGTTLQVVTNVSYDNGDTWEGWKAVLNGGTISDLEDDSVPGEDAILAVKLLFTSTTLAVPVVNTLRIEVSSALANGVWESGEIDLHNMDPDPDNSYVTWTYVENNASIKIYARSKLYVDGAWGSYSEVTKDTWPVGGEKMQLKIEVTPTIDTLVTPEVSLLKLLAKPLQKKGYYLSQAMDISLAEDKSTGKLIINTDLASGRVAMYTRTCATSGGTYSAWAAPLPDGSLVSPENNFIEIYLVLVGESIDKISDATLVFDGEASVTSILSGMTVGAEYTFTTLKDILIIANGKDAPRRWDAVDASPTLLGGSPPVLDSVVTHQNRVWGIDGNNKSRVRFSDIYDPETWSALNFIDFNPEDGDYCTALCRSGQDLVVSKQRSMALLTGNSLSNYSVVWMDTEQGAMGKRAAFNTSKYFIYVAQDGVRFTDFNNSVVAVERLLPNWESINKRRLNQAAIVFWKNTLLVAMPTENSLYNNTVWAYDFLRNAWSIIKGWNVNSWATFNQYGEEFLYAADSLTGQVYEVMRSSAYDDDVAIEYEYRIKDFHFNFPERYKLFQKVNLDIEGTTEETTLYVDLIVDGVTTGTYDTVIPAGEGAKYSRMILPPLYDAVLGRTFSLKFKGKCGIQSIAIQYSVGGIVPDEEV